MRCVKDSSPRAPCTRHGPRHSPRPRPTHHHPCDADALFPTLARPHSFGLSDTQPGEIRAICDRTAGIIKFSFTRRGVPLCPPIELSAERAEGLRGLRLVGVICCHMGRWNREFVRTAVTVRKNRDELRLIQPQRSQAGALATPALRRWLHSVRAVDLKQIQS